MRDGQRQAQMLHHEQPTSLLLSPCRFDKSTEKTVYHSLVVVGAGFSGLYAARLLRKQFPDLLVVEADNRIGGRVKPLEGLVSWPVQEGPECATECYMQDNLIIVLSDGNLLIYTLCRARLGLIGQHGAQVHPRVQCGAQGAACAVSIVRCQVPGKMMASVADWLDVAGRILWTRWAANCGSTAGQTIGMLGARSGCSTAVSRSVKRPLVLGSCTSMLTC